MLFSYGAKSMPSLEEDLPDIAAEIRRSLPENAALQEAFADYQTACRRLRASESSASERAEWTRIKQELLTELERLNRRASGPERR